MNRNTKNFLRIASLGALLGAFLTNWIAPKAISWYFDPPAGFGISCKDPIDWALGRFQTAQLFGLIIGGVLGIVAFFLLARGKSDAALPPNNNNY